MPCCGAPSGRDCKYWPTLNDITPVFAVGRQGRLCSYKVEDAGAAGRVRGRVARDRFTNDDGLASYDPPWDAGSATLKAVELAGNWSDIFDRDDAYVPRIIIKSNGTRIWTALH